MHQDYDKEKTRAGSQRSFTDDDLADIMALLEKDYTKPQPQRVKPQPEPVRKPEPRQQKAPQDDDLADVLALLEKDYTKPQSTPAPAAAKAAAQVQWDIVPEMTAADSLPQSGSWEPDKFLPGEPKEKKPLFSWGKKEQPEQKAAPAPKKEEDSTPPKKEWAVIPLAILTVAEAAALIFVITWWIQWL